MKKIRVLLSQPNRFDNLLSRSFWLAVCLAAFAYPARSSVVFTTNTVINATNLTYDGQDIVVNGCTLTVDGAHAFNSVSASNAAVITHDAATTNEAYSLNLTVTNGLIIDATSRIDVSARGYLPGYTTGNSTNGGAYNDSGGSYGGLGWSSSPGVPNAVYGDYHYPTEPGSGSGIYLAGVPGGGLVQITAGSALIDGSILANGSNSVFVGGSGGGIYLNVGALSGSGAISANGGNGTNYGAGGGGRVAILYGSVSGIDLTNDVTANAGSGTSDRNGSVGTVYLEQSGQPGDLLIDSHGKSAALWTPLGLPTDTVFQVGTLEVIGTNAIAATPIQMPIEVGSVLVQQGGVLTHQPTTSNQVYSLVMTVSNNLLVDASSRIDASGRGYLPGYTAGNTTNGAAYSSAAGSYGGLGWISSPGIPNAVYGDYHYPTEPGSGSGIYGGGASGGGLIQITAGSAEIDGLVMANGAGGAFVGGSGGGIYLNVGALSGTGRVGVNGGNGTNAGGGGGGRVAVLYGSVAGMDLSTNVTADAGVGPHDDDGSVGTVYLQQNGQPGELLITGHGKPAALWTPLGLATDAAFQVDTLEVVGTNAVAAPAHQMPMEVGTVMLQGGGVLTHQPTTTNQVYSLVLTVSNSLVVDASSRIDVSTRGYLAGYTVGDTTNGGATDVAAGSYGGLGASQGSSIANAVYGDFRYPTEPGSGSGSFNGSSAAGGGLAQITALAAQIDGAILANGSNGGYGGGSGGGIYFNVGTLSGAGQINANGGNGTSYCGGGGGRVAIVYAATNGFNLYNNVAVDAGTGTSGRNGSVGTLYFQQAGQPGQLVITAHGTPAGLWTPLGNTTDTVFQVGSLLLTGSNTVAVTAAGAPISAMNVSVVNGATLSHLPATTNEAFSLDLTVSGTLLVDATSSINISGCGYLPGYTFGNTTVGAATGAAGGSYGGLASGNSGNVPNMTYGDYRNPNELGSGSGTFVQGVPGGGLARITADIAEIEGSILANGSNGGLGGSSGGGIYLNVGTLSGNGLITANGGNAAAYYAGGGGRIAIFYGVTNGFNLTNNVTVDPGIGGSGDGAEGTVYLQQFGQLGQLFITSHNGTNVGQWTPLGQATDTNFPVDTMIIRGSNVVAAPGYVIPIQAGNVLVQDGAVLTHPFTTPKQEYSLNMTVTNSLLVDALSRIDVSYRGYPINYTLGDLLMPTNMMYNAGSYGGLGSFTGGGTTGISTYGDPHNPNNLGSASGSYAGGGAGGGLIRITAGEIEVDGAILANGQPGVDSGAGGGVLLNAGTLSGNGQIAANAGLSVGDGLDGLGANGGGGGRVAIYTWQAMNLPATNVSGKGGFGTNGSGQAGSVIISSLPWPAFNNLSNFWHGTFPFSWVSYGIGPDSTYQAELTISGAGSVVFDQMVPLAGTLSWNSTGVSNGIYTATLTLFNGSAAVGQTSQNGVVNNSVSWHEGTLTTNQTWSSNVVNVVDQTVVIPSGVTLTIAPGAIIKFVPGTEIIVETGGVLNTLGTSAAPIVFTSIYDDSVGGDTALDGGLTKPQPGDWAGIVVLGGQFVQNSFVSVLYTEQITGGTLTASQTLLGNSVYIVNSVLTIPSGVTVTVNPGAVLKFIHGAGITVNDGGTLVAAGTLEQPIYFTSINDDAVGGNTGGDGSASTPEPGDWVNINVSGKATFVHSDIRYGGNTGGGVGASGIIIVQGGQLTVSNSVVEDTLFDGISVEGGGTGTIVNSVLRNTDRAVWASGTGTITQVINCTFDQNIIGVDDHGFGATLNVANSIIANSIQGSSIDQPVTFTYCDLWSSYTNSANPNVIGTNGNISANPQFVNEPLQNFQLNYGSPCVDAADGLLAPLTDFDGDPRYNDPLVTVKTGVTNSQGNYPDIGAFEFVQSAPSDVDLIVTTVGSPTSITANSNMTVQWIDENIGTGSAIGPWHDSVALVSQSDTNTVLAVGDVLVAQGLTLGPGQSYTASATFRVPGGVEGNYLAQVHVNNLGEVFEGANWTNNISLGATPTSLIVPILPIGGSVGGQLTAAGQADLYRILPAAGQDVQLTLQSASSSNAVEIFAAQGYVPGPAGFDLKSGEFDSPQATLNIAQPNGAAYYIVAYPEVLIGFGFDYTLTAVAPTGIAVSGVAPTRLPATGTATVEITGSLLSTADAYKLVGPTSTYTASSVTVPDLTTAYATFTLSNALAGSYNLEVLPPGGTAAVLTNAFTVSAGAGVADFWAQLQLPSVYRQGRQFSAAILYGNGGTADMPAPVLILGAGGVASLQLFPTNAFSTNDIYLFGASMQGPAGTLRAGASWNIPFAALSTVSETIPFSLAYKLADATDAVDYVTLGTQVRPPGYTDAQWNTAWNLLQSEAGPTWGGLITLLDGYVTQMADADAAGQSVGTFYLESDVFAYASQDFLARAETTVAGTLYLGNTNQPLPFTEIYMDGASTNQVGAAESGLDGTFRFANLPNGTYTATVPGYFQPITFQLTVTNSGGPPETGLTIIVEEGATIAGTIQNENGTLFLTNVQVAAVSTGTNGSFSAATGVDGTYVLNGLPPDTYNLTVGGDPYAVQNVFDVTVTSGQTLTENFFLSLGASLTGTVMGEGSPLTNAIVALTDDDGNISGALTDTTGNFDASGLQAGAYTVEVEAPGFAPFFTATNLTGGVTSSVGTVTLTSGATITATVDTGSSQPVTNGLVTVMQDGNIIAQMFTGSNGVAALPNLAAGTYDVVTTAYGYQTVTNVVTVTAGQSASASVKTSLLGTVSGRVTSGLNTPVTNFQVNVTGAGTNTAGFSAWDFSDAQGNYSIAGLAPGAYIVTVGNNAGIEEQPLTIPASLAPQTLNFTLTGVEVEGYVYAADGVTPIPVANVALSQGSNLLSTANTDTNGFYIFRILLPGAYNLAAGSLQGISTNVSVTLSSGGPTEPPPKSVVTAPPLTLGPFALLGTVTDQEDNAITNAAIALYPPGGFTAPMLFSATTSSDGSFSVTGLAPGQYVLEVQAPSMALSKQSVNISRTTNLLIALSPGIPLTGVITDAATGAGISNALIGFFDSASHSLMAITNSDVSGSYSGVDLLPGTYDILISATNYEVQELAAITVSANPLVENAALSAAATLLQGAATDTSGNPIAGALILIVDSIGETPVILTTGDDGSFASDQLLPGNYTITLWAPGYLPPSEGTISLAAGSPQTVDLSFTPVATDDASGQFFYTFSQGIANSLGAIPCVQPPDEDIYTSRHLVTPPSCPCAEQATLAVRKALTRATFQLNTDYETWEKAAADGKANAGSDIAVTAIHGSQSILDGIASFGPLGNASTALSALQAYSDNKQTAVVMTQLVSADVAINEALMSAAGSTNAATFFANFAQTLYTLGYNVMSFQNLIKATVQAKQGWSPGNKAGLILDGLQNVVDAIQLYENWEKSLGDCQKAQVDFNLTYKSYLAAWNNYEDAVTAANDDCGNCPPQPPYPPYPPPPPNPNPVIPNPNPVPPGQSYDPNNIFTTGFGPAGYVQPSVPITYTIIFANETNATLPAQTVTITDILPTNLDLSTLQFGTIGFNNVTIAVASGAQAVSATANVSTDPNPVQVTASLNPTNGTLTWFMESINPATGQLVTDPVAGFLPPDNAEQQGEGFVTFTIQPKPGLATGVQLLNSASIVFDVNPPIITPNATNTIDSAPPVSSVTPLPAQSSQTNLTVSWSGTDAGSGIEGYTIFVSTNGGLWGAWVLETTNTSAVFVAAYGNSYAFYSVAVDGAGNVETSPQIPGTETIVESPLVPTLQSPSLTNGQIKFTVTGAAGDKYAIQASTNLLQWVPILTNTSPFIFVDTNSPNYSSRWYRAVLSQ